MNRLKGFVVTPAYHLKFCEGFNPTRSEDDEHFGAEVLERGCRIQCISPLCGRTKHVYPTHFMKMSSICKQNVIQYSMYKNTHTETCSHRSVPFNMTGWLKHVYDPASRQKHARDAS